MRYPVEPVPDERRRFPRLPVRREVEVRFAVRPLFPVFEALSVKLVPPTGTAIALDAVVRNVLQNDAFKWSAGVEFQSLRAAGRAAIEKLPAAHTVGT